VSIRFGAAVLVAAFLTAGQVSAQGFYLNREVQLPDTSFTTPFPRQALPVVFPDTRSAGMGRTRIADENALTSFRYNPGFLGRTDRVAGTGGIIANAPVQTVDAVVFIGGNVPELEGAVSLRALQDAVDAYRNGVGFTQQVEEKLANVYAFGQELFAKVVGDPDNPDLHGAMLDVSAQMQVGHWGFSLDGYGQTAMAAYPGPILSTLTGIYLRTDFSDSTEAAEALAELGALVDEIRDPLTGNVKPGALPAFYSLTYMDIVATAGYGLMVADSLSVGANLKIINRRFSAARISAATAGDITQELFGDLKSGVTGVTFDLGAVYRTTAGLTIGMNLQNLVPVSVLSSGYSLNFNSFNVRRDLDSAGNPIVNADGDTALVASAQNTLIEGPAELALPFVANIGAMFRINEDWDASFELVDIAQQVSTYENYAQRFGFGMEYRFHFFGDYLHVAPRIGFASTELTAGLGVSYRGFITLNAAYYTSAIVKARKNIAVQLSVNW
jgi:hypothetical protein